MSAFKLTNAYDPKVKGGNLASTIKGILTALLSILLFAGVISLDQQTELTAQGLTLVDAVVAIVAAVQAIINVFFIKDPV